MRWGYVLIMSLTLGIFSGGCTSTKVFSDQASGTNLSSYKTYAWLPSRKDTTSKSVFNNDITLKNIRVAADNEMKIRNYSPDVNDPDLLLLVHTNFEKKEELVSNPVYSSYNYYYPGFYGGPWYSNYYSGYYNIPYVNGYSMQEVEYTEGTVVIDVIDRKKNQLIWRGWSEEQIYDYEDVQAMYENVDKIFKKFPVRERKN